MKKIFLILIIALFSKYAISQDTYTSMWRFPTNVNILTGETSADFRLTYNGLGSLSYPIIFSYYRGGEIFAFGGDFGIISKTFRFKDHLIPVNENGIINWREDDNPNHSYNNNFFFGNKSRLGLNYFNISPGFIINTNITQIKINLTADLLLWTRHVIKCSDNEEKYKNVTFNNTEIGANRFQYGVFIGLGLPDMKHSNRSDLINSLDAKPLKTTSFQGIMIYYKASLMPLFKEGNGSNVFVNEIGITMKPQLIRR